MVWISSNTIFLTTTWFLRFHKGKLDLWGCFMLICWPKQRATVILLQLMTFLSFALLKYDQNIWILYAWLIPVCYGKQKGKEKKAIRFRLNCPHLNLFSLSPFFFFTCAFYRDILNSHTCTRVQFEGRMHKVMWAELKSLCSTYLFCAPAWLFTTSNSYICIYCQGLLSRFIQIKSGVIWVERMNAWTWIKLRKGKIE